MEHKEESKPPSPYVECGKIPKAKFVKDKSDMEDIEVRGECSEDKDIERLHLMHKQIFYYSEAY